MRSCKMQERLGVTALVAALAISACGDNENKTKKTAMCSASAGDLQITEFLVNPNGLDNTKEWFEIKNISGSDQILNGLVLRQEVINTKDGTISKTKEYTVKTSDFSLAQGNYFVFGDGDSDWVDHNYGSGLADWNNTSSILSIVCDDTVIDSVAYGSDKLLGKVVEGAAFSFDGKTWCSAVNSYDNDGNLGTPGAANPSCDTTYCKNNGSMVTAKSPAANDLIFTEIFANPRGIDGKKEYIELYNAAGKEIDLFNMRVEITIDGSTEPKQVFIMATNETKAKRESCVRTNNQIILLGQSADQEANGGLDINAIFSDSLPNSGKNIIYSLYSGSTLITETPAFPTPKDGDVWAIHPQFLDDFTSTDSWCIIPYSNEQEASMGTPGAANEECTVMSDNTDVPPAPPSPSCTGTAPAEGDLVITEIYSDAEGAAGNEFSKEFIEVFATKAVTASALKIVSKSASKNRNFTVNFGKCYTFTPNSYVVFDGNTDADNPAAYTRFNYTGSKDGLFQPKDGYSLEIYYNDTMIDTAPNHIGTETASSQLDSTKLSAFENDNKANWCKAAPTPGVANGVCENTNTDGDSDDIGDNTDTPITCEGEAPAAGDLVITEMFYDPKGSASDGTEAQLEFMELLATKDVNLSSLTLKTITDKNTTRTFNVQIKQCVTFEADSIIVLAANGDKETNGNMDVDLIYAGVNADSKKGFSNPSSNTVEYTATVSIGDTIIDSITYKRVTEGQSYAVIPEMATSELNDNINNWCANTPTPGGIDMQCPTI